WVGGASLERGEAVAVRGLQNEVGVLDRGAGKGRDRRARVEVVTHGCSAVDRRHPLGRVALARRRARRQDLVEPLELLRGELDRGGGRVLLEVLPALRSRDRDDVPTLVEHPGERELPRRHSLLGRDL